MLGQWRGVSRVQGVSGGADTAKFFKEEKMYFDFISTMKVPNKDIWGTTKPIWERIFQSVSAFRFDDKIYTPTLRPFGPEAL
jgi:hypothetical protein